MSNSKSYWLLKSEPSVFSFQDLLSAPKQTTAWEGVRNYQARNFMRDIMREGDLAFFYHSSTEEPGIQGIVEVVKEAYADPAQWDKKSEHYDAKAPRGGEPRWVMVDVKAKRPLPKVMTLAELKKERSLTGMALLQKGQRLSVQPVTPKEWDTICKLCGLK